MHVHVLSVGLVYIVGSVENAECGVWKVQSVENAECGKCGVWKVWKVRSVENVEHFNFNIIKNNLIPLYSH